MKKFWYSALAATLVLTGCQKESEDTSISREGQTISFIAETSVDTKSSMEIDGTTVKYSWTDDDKDFHVFYETSEASPVTSDLASNGTMSLSATFEPNTLPTEGEVAFTGYLNGSVKASQTMDAVKGSYDPTSDVMIAKASVSAADLDKPVLFQFKRMVSVAKLTLSGLSESADRVIISSDKQILGSFDHTGNYTAKDGVIEVNRIGDNNVVYFTLAPVADATLTVTAFTSDGVYVGTTNGPKTFKAGNVRGTTVAMTRVTQLFKETFDTNTGQGGNDGQWMGNIASNTLNFDNEGWTNSNGSGADKCAKFGSSKAKGIATTPGLGVNGEATISFRAGAWNNDATTLILTVVGEGSLSVGSVEMLNNNYSAYIVTITNATPETKISFSSKNTSNSRFFLDEVVAYNTDPYVEPEQAEATWSISPEAISVQAGRTATATIETDYNGILSVSSEDSEIATATISGKSITVTGVAEGSTTLSVSGAATSQYNAISKTIDVTVTAETALTTIDDIFTEATKAATNATPVKVKFNNWVVSGVKNSNVYVTDGTKGFIIYASGHGFESGDILSGTVNCKVQLYKGSAEITTLTSTSEGLNVTKGGSVTPINIAISDLSGINTGAVLTFTELTYNGSAFSDGINTITPYNTFITLPALVTGKKYSVEGMYIQYDATKEIAPRKASDIAEKVAPKYAVSVAEGISNGSVNVDFTEATEGQTVTITTTADPGYKLKSVSAKTTSGVELVVTNKKFTMPAESVVVSAEFEESIGGSWTIATMAAGTNGSTAKVNDKDAIKVGTSNKGGDMTITVAAGSTKVRFYAAAWNGVTGLSLNITPEAKVKTTSISLTADTGVANNSPFTLVNDESSYLFEIDLNDITAETTLKLTSSLAKRFVVWGAEYFN